MTRNESPKLMGGIKIDLGDNMVFIGLVEDSIRRVVMAMGGMKTEIETLRAEVDELSEKLRGACVEVQRLTDEAEMLSVANEEGKAALAEYKHKTGELLYQMMGQDDEDQL